MGSFGSENGITERPLRAFESENYLTDRSLRITMFLLEDSEFGGLRTRVY